MSLFYFAKDIIPYRKLPVRCVRAVEEILPECLCARRQRPDRHHLVEVAELRDEARHRFLGHRKHPFHQIAS